MNEVNESVKQAIQKTFFRLFESTPSALLVQPTNEEFEGTHTLVCFPLAQMCKMKPDEVAKILGDHLMSEHKNLFLNYNVVKGFLNLSLTHQTWYHAFWTMIHSSMDDETPSQKEEIVVEFSSPNTNKPLHLGHLRNNFLGASMSNMYQALGHRVHNVQIINDRGIHICKSMVAWKKQGKGKTPQHTNIKGDKFVGNYYVAFEKLYQEEKKNLLTQGCASEEAEQKNSVMNEAHTVLKKWEQKDPDTIALWNMMNNWVYDGFDITYKRMGIYFEKLYYESDTYLLGKEEVLKGVDRNIFYTKKDGSIWVDLTSEGLDEKLLLRADGTSVYMTQDIGTALLRYRDFPNLSRQIYTVGSEQDYHFRVLFLILKKLGYTWASRCYHLSYGMVDLPSGRMKSREGTVVDADDLMEEMVVRATKQAHNLGKTDTHDAGNLFEMIGIGALKYYLLKVDPKKRVVFNPDESIQLQGHTAPFIQYTHARICSLLSKCKEEEKTYGADERIPDTLLDLLPSEIHLIHLLLDYSSQLHQAVREYAPSVMANYAYALAKQYNHFYQSVPILGESNPSKRKLRIIFSSGTSKIIKKSMLLLGIDVPERM